MKLGVVGPTESVELIRGVILKDRIPVEMVALEYQTYTETAAMVEQRQPELDAIFFSGALPFRYASRYVRPQVPWEYVPPNTLLIAYAMIKAAHFEKADLSRISTDSFTRQLFLDAYQEAGLPVGEATILCAGDRHFSPDYVEYLVDYHRTCYETGQASCCITGISEVKEKLQRQGIPTVMAQIGYESISLSLSKLRLRCAEHALSLADVSQSFTVLTVEVGHVREHTLFEQSDVALLQQKQKIAERIYTFAQGIGSAIVQDNEGRFLLFSSGRQLEIATDQFRKIELLDQLLGIDLIDRVFMGIGMGATNFAAKHSAERALRNAQVARVSCAYMVRGETVYGPIMPFSTRSAALTTPPHLLEIARRSGVNLRTLEQLELVTRQYGLEHVTPAQLSRISGIKARNLNRILNKLEDAGFVSVVGKESRVELGRPGRLIKIHFAG